MRSVLALFGGLRCLVVREVHKYVVLSLFYVCSLCSIQFYINAILS